MIDPKLNELPDEQNANLKKKGKGESLTEEQKTARLRETRSGLSINETVAENANLSVGSSGVDTSGVKAGAGAGAGMTKTTPTTTRESPAPNIVPGARGTGMTVGEPTSSQTSTSRLQAEADYSPTAQEIAARAHQNWEKRGCPEGSSEVDWQQAEQELRAERRVKSAKAGQTR